MKDRIARLLFAYLTRMGLVLCVGDPDAPAGGDVVDAGAANASVNTEEAEGNTASDATPPATPDEREKLIRKLERRIGTRTRALGERDATIAQLQRELAAARAADAPRNDPDDDDTTDADDAPRGARRSAVDVETLAEQRAHELRRGEKIANSTRSMLEAGTKLDPKFRDLVLDVAADLPFIDERGRATEFIEEVLDTDRPADLLLHLARNPDVAESLQGLTGAKLGRRLEKLVSELTAAPKRSTAPAPLEPVGGRGNSAKADKAMSDEEWRAHRLRRAA